MRNGKGVGTCIGVLVILTIVFGGHRILLPASQAESAARPTAKDSNWPSYNGHANGDHYSNLSQINRGNVDRLNVAWRFDTGEKGGIQANPIVVGRVLYAYTPSEKVVALDAATGALLWKFDSGVNGTQPARGVSFWTDGKQSRIFAGITNYLYALEATTGQPLKDFGEEGRIDLRKDLRGDYEQQSIALTTPGIVYKDLIIVGGRNPETHPAPPGDIRAFDVHTGALRWRFHTIPHPGEFGYDTWPRDAWKQAGAANNWAGMTLDALRGIVYVPTGSAVFDFYGGDRVGNNLFADTLLALDANTGRRLWHFQGVHHDIWDRDFPAAPALLTVTHDGRKIDAVAQTTKQGVLYLFDRVTGHPLFPIKEHPYPDSSVPGEKTSPTQPMPMVPEPYARQRLTASMLTTRTPQAHAWALAEFKKFRSDGQFLPFVLDQQTVVFPGFDGGGEWGGPAVDPSTGILYVNANEMAWTGGLTADVSSGDVGADTYQSQCAVCHGVNRAGSQPAFPSLVGVENRLTQQQVTEVISHGKGRMPALPHLSGDQITALLEYLKTEVTGAPDARTQNVAAQTSENAFSANAAAQLTSGSVIYKSKCAMCHREDRQGKPPLVPMLIGVSQRISLAQAASTIHQGKGRMPAQPDIQGSDLDALLQYLGFAANAKAVSAQVPGAEDTYKFTGYRRFLDPDGFPAISPPWGTLNAINLNTGKFLWKIPLGEYPALASKGKRPTGTENYGGPIVTAGGLVFIGATVYDRKFRAFDSLTGKLLWQTTLPFSGVATPATYSIDGKQYVVIAASGGRDPKSPTGGMYIAFSLP